MSRLLVEGVGKAGYNSKQNSLQTLAYTSNTAAITTVLWTDWRHSHPIYTRAIIVDHVTESQIMS